MNPVLAHRPTLVQGEKLRLYPGMTQLNENVAISIKNRSYTVAATIEALEGTLNGVILTQGGRPAGSCSSKTGNRASTTTSQGSNGHPSLPRRL